MCVKVEFHFPEELLLLILIRLPVLSLLRFRCVSKYWYSLISNSDFIDSHLHHNHNHNHNQGSDNYKVLFKKTLSNLPKEIYSLHADNQQFQEIETLNFPFKEFTIVGCVNGLICLFKTNYNNSMIILLWNPCIRKFFILPEQPIYVNASCQMRNDESSLSKFCYGFGYDVSSNDYKYVSLVRDIESDRHALASVTVFSLATKSWNTLAYNVSLRPQAGSCNVGRFVYRLTTTPVPNKPRCYRYKIASFDLSAEVFTEIDLPKAAKGDKPVKANRAMVTNFRGALGLFGGYHHDKYDMWVMREDGVAKSWTKIFSINFSGSKIRQPHIVGFTTKGALLMVGDRGALVSPIVEDARVVRYVPPSNRYLFLPGDAWKFEWQLESFKESLVLLNVGVDLHLIDL